MTSTGRDPSARQNRKQLGFLTWSSTSNFRLVDGHFLLIHVGCGQHRTTSMQSSCWFWAKHGSSFSIHELLQKALTRLHFAKICRFTQLKKPKHIQEIINPRIKNVNNEWKNLATVTIYLGCGLDQNHNPETLVPTIQRQGCITLNNR